MTIPKQKAKQGAHSVDHGEYDQHKDEVEHIADCLSDLSDRVSRDWYDDEIEAALVQLNVAKLALNVFRVKAREHYDRVLADI